MVLNKALRKALTCSVSVALALGSMGPGVAVAFEGDLSPSPLTIQADVSLSYDSVYGVFSGQYAWMEMEFEYGDGQTAKVSDLVRADGEVVLHTTDAPDGVDVPGGLASFEVNERLTYSNVDYEYPNDFLSLGLVELKDKATGKVGLVNFEGDLVLPFEYADVNVVDSHPESENGAWFTGVTTNEEGCAMTVWDRNFRVIGTFDVELNQEENSTICELRSGWAGNYLWFEAYQLTSRGVYIFESDLYPGIIAVARQKPNGEYELAQDVVKWLRGDVGGASLVAKSDGKVYCSTPRIGEVAVATSENLSSGRISGPFVELSYGDLGSREYVHYVVSSEGEVRKFDLEGLDFWRGDGEAGLFLTYDRARYFSSDLDSDRQTQHWAGYSPNKPTEYRLYDDTGTMLDSFEAIRAEFFDSDTLQKTTWSDGTYSIDLYRPDGTWLRTVAVLADGKYDVGKGSIYGLTKRVGGVQRTVGYAINRERLELDDVYFDLDFNRVPAPPSDEEAATLADGTAVYGSVIRRWDSNEEAYKYSPTVANLAGETVAIGGYTLGIAVNEEHPMGNSFKHGRADFWWATDDSGNWGAVSSSGDVLVPFEYESYYDLGETDAGYVMVKKAGKWSFFDLPESAVGEPHQQMHRLYNSWSGEHFYTADESERDSVVAAGWTYEGVGWYAPSEGDAVFRVYNSYAGEHHYTLDATERDSLVAAGWTDEGVGWYSDMEQLVPLYREYNPYMYSCNHNYTTDKTEHDGLVALGWVDEGYAWYGV